MNENTKRPKDGAQRKRDFDKRQRVLGRKPRTFWATAEETRRLRELLEEMRGPK